jgi:DNA adenine methylase
MFAEFMDEVRENVASPFNYTGSKFHLIEQIRQNLPEKHSGVFWDLFCGGGSVFVNLADEFDLVVVNDRIKELIQFYKIIESNCWEDLEEIVQRKVVDKRDKEGYLALRERFNEFRDPTDLFVLCSSCTNNMMRFNKKFGFNQTWGKRQVNPNTYKKLKGYHDVIFSNGKFDWQHEDFYDLIPEEGDVVYLDPPYLITEAGYNAYWSKESEENLYDYLDQLDQGGVHFLLSNVSRHKGIDNPHMDRLKRYNIVNLDFDYDKVSRGGKSDSQEILVKNFS